MTTAHWKLDEASGAFEIKRLPRIGPTAGRDGVFLRRRIWRNESGFSYRPDPKHVDALVEWKMARLVATPFTRDNGTGQSNTLCELSLTEKAVYLSGSGLWQYIALDRMDVVLATKNVSSRTAKADVLALVAVETCGKVLGWSSRSCNELPVPRQPITDRLLHRRRFGWRRGNTIDIERWNVDARNSLA